MRRLVPVVALCLVLASLAVVRLDQGSLFRALWPAIFGMGLPGDERYSLEYLSSTHEGGLSRDIDK